MFCSLKTYLNRSIILLSVAETNPSENLTNVLSYLTILIVTCRWSKPKRRFHQVYISEENFPTENENASRDFGAIAARDAKISVTSFSKSQTWNLIQDQDGRH